jgi:integrase
MGDSIQINDELKSGLIEYMSEKGYSSNTKQAYRSNLRRLFDGVDILDRGKIAKYLKKNKHPNQRAIIRLLNQYCMEKTIDFNVAVPTVKQSERKIPKDMLSIEEIKVMISSAPYPYNLMLRCIFGMGAGLRISEALKLSWHHIRWVDWLANKEYGIAVLTETKRGYDRVVNIPNELMIDLYELAKQRDLLNEHGIPVGDIIFGINFNTYKQDILDRDVEEWKDRYIRYAYQWFNLNILRKYCDKALDKKVHAHQLRHSRATYLYEVEKIPIERIQQLLGHKDIQTTMIYTRIDPKSTFLMMKDTKVV